MANRPRGYQLLQNSNRPRCRHLGYTAILQSLALPAGNPPSLSQRTPPTTAPPQPATTPTKALTRKKMKPILLLKTKSTPTDPYDVLLASAGYTPIFVPVLQHHAVNGDVVREYVLSGGLVPVEGSDEGVRKFGAIIITSQRAVEALGTILDELKETHAQIVQTLLQTTTIYVVGPATRNSLINLGFQKERVVGEECGNGAVLADLIVEHYSNNFITDNDKGPGDLLFLTGETHSTIIPSRVPEKLKGKSGGLDVKVEEVVVYKTGVMEEFEADFRSCLQRLEVGDAAAEGEEEKERWIVFFSPTGTDAALRVLGEREEGKETNRGLKYKCCSIGPTTKDFMYQKFKRAADAMAKTPSPDGVLEAIRSPARVVAQLVS
ncbi:hypothetical protein TWF730_003574 [Orbilia blumenaviensis]|uniref:Tetrapyrrole biosynthesis uroporphyrinogen III synthase domain-containing protein n=1 Tax=Orbilia blumenaviensis TaxID=1796055 RepID=A0AAV9U4U3_9PEZI